MTTEGTMMGTTPGGEYAGATDGIVVGTATGTTAGTTGDAAGTLSGMHLVRERQQAPSSNGRALAASRRGVSKRQWVGGGKGGRENTVRYGMCCSDITRA